MSNFFSLVFTLNKSIGLRPQHQV